MEVNPDLYPIFTGIISEGLKTPIIDTDIGYNLVVCVRNPDIMYIRTQLPLKFNPQSEPGTQSREWTAKLCKGFNNTIEGFIMDKPGVHNIQLHTNGEYTSRTSPITFRLPMGATDFRPTDYLLSMSHLVWEPCATVHFTYYDPVPEPKVFVIQGTFQIEQHREHCSRDSFLRTFEYNSMTYDILYTHGNIRMSRRKTLQELCLAVVPMNDKTEIPESVLENIKYRFQ